MVARDAPRTGRLVSMAKLRCLMATDNWPAEF